MTVLNGSRETDGEVVVLKREPTPAGSITDLFDRLHELHLDAGEPGVRQIATGIGRGVLSYTTVHNVFRGPRVPKWGHLELIVDQLSGDVEEFRTLWRTARLAELSAAPRAQPVPVATALTTPAEPEVSHQESPTRLSEFVMVSYRLPPRYEADRQPSPSTIFRTVGAAATLHDVVVARDGMWVGWAGARGGPGGDRYTRVELPDREEEMYLAGYCNSTLWPLYHSMIEGPEFRWDWRDAYSSVNQRFADVIARAAAPGAVVWVHDYHLQLVPGLLREQRPDLRIGFFLHIPFPSAELFAQLPAREETLRGLLGADVIGFQHPRSVRNFLQLCEEFLGLPVNAGMVGVGDRKVAVDAFPISVDIERIERTARQPRVRQRARQLRTELGNPRTLLVGLDRLDYSKGIEQRLLAYGELLGSAQLAADFTTFLQVVTLSRENLSRYANLRQRVDRLVGHLNASYGTVGRPVVHYTNRVLDFEEIQAMYVAADVMMVTSLRDGMNLVSKEYVASRADNRGVLVLSEFTGAATELGQAILVNPNDIDDLKNAILQAVTMSRAEQRRRMEAMRAHLHKHDAQAWTDSFLTRLA